MLKSLFCRSSCFLFALLTFGYSQASIISITFEPATVPNSSSLISTWQENGMLFEATQGFMLHTDPANSSLGDHFADNGTTYMRGSFDTTINLSNINGDLFSLLEIDLAEFSDFRAQFTTVVNFTGSKQDGSEVLHIFTLDGIFDSSGPLNDFETVAFGTEFNDLVSVQIRSGDKGGLTNGFSMYNLNVQVVPLPSSI